jgi:hypothetical protein
MSLVRSIIELSPEQWGSIPTFLWMRDGERHRSSGNENFLGVSEGVVLREEEWLTQARMDEYCNFERYGVASGPNCRGIDPLSHLSDCSDKRLSLTADLWTIETRHCSTWRVFWVVEEALWSRVESWRTELVPNSLSFHVPFEVYSYWWLNSHPDFFLKSQKRNRRIDIFTSHEIKDAVWYHRHLSKIAQLLCSEISIISLLPSTKRHGCLRKCVSETRVFLFLSCLISCTE